MSKQNQKENDQRAQREDKKRVKRHWGKAVILASLIGGLLVVVYALVVPLEQTLPSPPSIVYKRVYFDRYVVAGNFRGGERSAYLGKLVVFYIKGVADVQYDTKHIQLIPLDNYKFYSDGMAFPYLRMLVANFCKLVRKGYAALSDKVKKNSITPVFQEKFVARYSPSPIINKFSLKKPIPFYVDVNIDQSDYYQVLEVSPKAISIEEATKISKSIAKVAGVIAGIGGAFIGARIGGKAGKMLSVVYRYTGGILGAIIGGALAGGGAYVVTHKFFTKILTGLQFSSGIDQAAKETILSKAKALIAAELLFDPRVSEELKRSFKKYVKKFYKRLGIEVVKVELPE